MALTDKSRRRGWSRLHFLVRILGLIGLPVAGVGWALAYVQGFDWSSWEAVRAALTEPDADPLLRVAVGMVAGGALLALLAIVFELVVILPLAAGRRGVFGLNVGLQVALAAALLVVVNLASAEYFFKRFDWTSDQKFTLPADVRTQLSELKDKTIIVVYQRHKTFGQRADKETETPWFDYAAERKVVEKVQDLVEQFRELGPQFEVHVLDVKEEDYDNQLSAATKDAPGLREAITSAPENSIFFYSKGKIQSITFNDFYLLDKKASLEQKNLVLLPQGKGRGIEPFANRVLNIEEKRPRVAVAVTHEELGTRGHFEEYALEGLGKALQRHGFHCVDIILKKDEFREPVVYTYEESQFDTLEREAAGLDRIIKKLEKATDEIKRRRADWEKEPLDKLKDKYFPGQDVRLTEQGRKDVLERMQTLLGDVDTEIQDQKQAKQAVENKKAGLDVDRLSEQRRLTDRKAKMERLLADCDLLIISRQTLNAFEDPKMLWLPYGLYHLDDPQVAAIKEFIKAGKPILVCFGPEVEPPLMGRRPDLPSGPDGVDKLLEELGVRFGKETILFKVEERSLAMQSQGGTVSGATTEVPAVAFNWPQAKANPIRESMILTADNVGSPLDLHLRRPRPVYYEHKDLPAGAGATFMRSNPRASKVIQPFVFESETQAPSASELLKGTPEERQKGFPLGVAVETRIPSSWYDGSKPAPSNKVRVVAIGHGGVFIGKELSPAKEKLLLDSCNWLLGRDDRLAHGLSAVDSAGPAAGVNEWKYHRVERDDRELALWRWGAWLGLPALFAFLGMAVLLVRRLR